jgi:hypothetical protein
VDRDAAAFHLDLDVVIPPIGFRRRRREAEDVVRLALREDGRHEFLRGVRVLDRAAARVVRVHGKIALSFEVPSGDPRTIGWRDPPDLCGGRECLQEIGINGMDSQVGHARRAEELLPGFLDLRHALEAGGDHLHAARNEQEHLAPLGHIAQGVRHDGHRFECADAAPAFAPLAFLSIVGKAHKRAVDGGAKDAAVGREVLRQRMGREDDRGKVSRAHLVDGGLGRASRGRHVLGADGAVEQNDDKPAVARQLIGDDIGGNVAHPCGRWIGRPVREVHRAEDDDGPNLAVFADDEILSGQSANRTPFLVEHRDIDVDDVDASSEGGLRLSLDAHHDRCRESGDRHGEPSKGLRHRTVKRVCLCVVRLPRVASIVSRYSPAARRCSGRSRLKSAERLAPNSSGANVVVPLKTDVPARSAICARTPTGTIVSSPP